MNWKYFEEYNNNNNDNHLVGFIWMDHKLYINKLKGTKISKLKFVDKRILLSSRW